MGFLQTAFLLIACAIGHGGGDLCNTTNTTGEVAGVQTVSPQFTGTALDVLLTAEAAIVWDTTTGEVLYEKAVDERRPVASLMKLFTILTVNNSLNPTDVIEIPAESRRAQLRGANIQLPIGHHATVDDLIAASLIPSANDAAVALAVASAGSEDAFASELNEYIATLGFTNTQAANATGLSGGQQYSTAKDVMRALQLVYEDKAVAGYLSAQGGTLQTVEGATRSYKTTNRLLGTYLPILAAKTGYTVEAGENLALITQDDAGHSIGAVILGSSERFQDMKVLVEWIWRNYTWPS